MNLEKFNSFITLGANLGVLIGVIFLITELIKPIELQLTKLKQLFPHCRWSLAET